MLRHRAKEFYPAISSAPLKKTITAAMKEKIQGHLF
jgi:hypothetical protein